MGSGKSTVGPLLAEALAWDFYDLDHRIESVIGMPIATFFKKEGEPAFRKVEREALWASESDNRTVIAVGGGALCNPDNLDWAKSHGTVVYLSVSIHALVKRLKAEQTTRPMLLGDDGQLLEDETVTARIANLLESRLPLYEQSDLTIDTDGLRPKEIAKRLAMHFKKQPETRNPKL